MIRTLMRIGDAPARRMLVAYCVVVACATLLTSAAFVTILPLTIALLSDDPASALSVLGMLVTFGLLAGVLDFTGTLLVYLALLGYRREPLANCGFIRGTGRVVERGQQQSKNESG
jgi:hypothetical protein